MFVQCPFYGYRWPERRPELIEVGGNECGLELDTWKTCQMEAAGRNVNYACCPVALKWKPILEVARNEIRFQIIGRLDAPTLDERVREVMKAERVDVD
jgi:hypothetical protein